MQEFVADQLTAGYVHPMAKGAKLGTFAYTDYGDAFDVKTRVTRKGNEFVLNGKKALQTGGALADLFMTYVRDEHVLQIQLGVVAIAHIGFQAQRENSR